MSISNIFIPNFVRVSHIIENILNIFFYSVAGVMPQGWNLGVLGVKNFSEGIYDGAPSTVHSSIILF